MNTSPQDEQPKGAPGASPPKHKSTWRAVFWAFLFCFLWQFLMIRLIAPLSDFIPRPYALILYFWLPVVIAAVILYPACRTTRNPVFRGFMVLLSGAVLYCVAFFLWVVILRPSLGVGP